MTLGSPPYRPERRFGYLTKEYGLGLHGWIVEWCKRTERELANGLARARDHLARRGTAATGVPGPSSGRLPTLSRAMAALKPVYLITGDDDAKICLLYTSPSPRDRTRSRMPSSA